MAALRNALEPSSPAFRHATRLALAVPASALLAAAADLPRGYWVPFSVSLILKPDYSTLVRRGVGRLVGTALGATLTALLVSALHPGEPTTVALVAAFALGAYTLWSASFPVAVAFTTALVLSLLSFGQPNPATTALDRLLDVVIGGAVAALAYLAWPTKPAATVGAALDRLFGALGDYQRAIAPTITGAPAPASTSDLSRAARVAYGRAEGAIGRAVEEPARTRADEATARGVLAAAMRVLRALHALRAESAHGDSLPESASLAELNGALGAALTRLSGSGAHWPDLRALYADAVAPVEGGHARLCGHLDELVNALDTAEQLRYGPVGAD